MRTIHVEQLTHESFRPFGSFTDLLNPDGPHLGVAGGPLEFFRDGLMQHLGSSTNLAHSCCRVRPRPMIIDVLEYHSHTAEAMLALDNDMIVQVAPATPPQVSVPLDEFRAFAVSRGTIITLLPGVWHHGPFSPNKSSVHILVCLPERTYANDCIVVELKKQDRVKIAP
jgi:ureidoglycolate lyase